MNDWVEQMIKYTHHGLVADKDIGNGKLVNSYTRVQTTPSTIENNYKYGYLNNSHGNYEMYYSLDEFKHSAATTVYSRNSFFGETYNVVNPAFGYIEKYSQLPYGCTAGVISFQYDSYGRPIYGETVEGVENTVFPNTNKIVCAGHTIATYYITVDMLTDVDFGRENNDGTITTNENFDMSNVQMTSNFGVSLMMASLRDSALSESYNNTFGSSNPETSETAKRIALFKLVSNWRTRYGVLMPRGRTDVYLGYPKAIYTGLSDFSPSVSKSKAVIFNWTNMDIRNEYFKAAFNDGYYYDNFHFVDFDKDIHYSISNLAFKLSMGTPNWYWDQLKEYYFTEGTDFNPSGITD